MNKVFSLSSLCASLLVVGGLVAGCTPFALPATPTIPSPGAPTQPTSAPRPSTGTPPLNTPGPEIRQAYETLRTADTFAGDAVGIAGTTPDTVLALRVLLEDPAVADLLKRLLDEATLPGQLYALAGLYLVDPDYARAAAAPYLVSDALVETVFGCIVSQQPVSDLVAQILDGDLPRALAGRSGLTTERIERDLVLKVEFNTSKTITPGGHIDVDIFLVNESRQYTYPVVKPGDGSEVGWREPHVYYTAKRKKSDDTWEDVPQAYGRCGLYDPDWQKDVVQLRPGDSIRLEWLPSPSVMLDLREPGLVRLYVHYRYGGGTSARGQTPQTPVNLGGMEGVPAFEIVSAPIEIEIVLSSPTGTATPSPAVNPYVEISANATTLQVGDTVTIMGVPVDIGLPYYTLYLDDQAIARVTYGNEVRSEGGTNAVLEFVSAEGAMRQARFLLRAKAAGTVQARINATGEVHWPDGATWSGGGSEPIQITVTAP